MGLYKINCIFINKLYIYFVSQFELSHSLSVRAKCGNTTIRPIFRWRHMWTVLYIKLFVCLHNPYSPLICWCNTLMLPICWLTDTAHKYLIRGGRYPWQIIEILWRLQCSASPNWNAKITLDTTTHPPVTFGWLRQWGLWLVITREPVKLSAGPEFTQIGTSIQCLTLDCVRTGLSGHWSGALSRVSCLCFIISS